jgi:signal transduction histidine kinase
MNGKISISVKAYTPSANRHKIYVSISDTGIGIPADKILTIFKKFETLENGNELNPNRVGLGLYICRKVAE